MTDNSGFLRTRAVPVVLSCALAVLAAGTVTAIVGVDDLAGADTVVTNAVRAVVALPDGTEHAAFVGEQLPQGAQVRTGQGGAARLTTSGRDVWLGAVTTVRVLDGAREDLDRGLVMVDSRRGARLSLGTQAGTVTAPAGSLTRVERAVVLRVASYEGGASLAPRGRSTTADVPALHQVTAQYGGLPGPPTALALTRDSYERQLVRQLVEADEDLTGFQTGLGGADGVVLLAATRRDLVDASAGCALQSDRGERALSLAVAQAAQSAGEPVEHLDTVCSSRAEGGSWGVVAAIVRASVTGVTVQLGKALDVEDPTTVTSAVGPGIDVGTLLPVPTVAPSPSATGTGTGSPAPRPVGGSTATPTAAPPSAPPPGVVDTLVGLVTSLLPTPTPSAAAPVATQAPAPAATKAPLLEVGGIKVG